MRNASAALRALVLVGLFCGFAVGWPFRSAKADDGTVHRLALPEGRRAATGRDWAAIDAAPGEPPSAAHRYGTVVVAEAMAPEPSPSVTEWDLADGAMVRSAALPLSAAFCELRVVRAGDAFHVVAAEGRSGHVVYVRLGRELEIRSVQTIGAGERPRLETDGAIVAMLWAGTRERGGESAGWQLLTFDGGGARLGEARLLRAGDSTYLFGRPLVVAAGRVFVVLPGGGRLRVAQFAPDGKPEQVRPIPWAADDGRLFAIGDRVFFTDDCRSIEVVDLASPGAPDAEPRLLPGRPAAGRVCVAFEAAADGSGRLVTTAGELLDTQLQPLGRFVHPEGLVMRALWLHGLPAVVIVGGPGGRASVVWSSD
jgi:hypothetical protein